MARPTRKTMILLLVVAALGLAALAEQVRDMLLAPTPITSLDLKTVRRITIECAACPTRELEKIAGQWRLTRPFAMPADREQVDHLLAFAHVPVTHRRNFGKIDAAAAGLAPPRARVTIGGIALEVGDRDPLRQQRHVRRGDEAMLVPDSWGSLVSLTAESLVDPRPFHAEGAIAGATLDGKPVAPDVLGRLTALRATRVVPAPAGARGRVVTVERAERGALRLELCRYGNGWLLVRAEPALAYELSADDARLLSGGDEAPR